MKREGLDFEVEYCKWKQLPIQFDSFGGKEAAAARHKELMQKYAATHSPPGADAAASTAGKEKEKEEATPQKGSSAAESESKVSDEAGVEDEAVSTNAQSRKRKLSTVSETDSVRHEAEEKDDTAAASARAAVATSTVLPVLLTVPQSQSALRTFRIPAVTWSMLDSK